MQKYEVTEKDTSTDTTEESPRSDMTYSISPNKRRAEGMTDEKYAQKKEK
jgi:hypothetical protein